MNKKQGVIMLEVLILLNVLIVLIVYNSKTIIANLNKCELYEIKEDVLYLESQEYYLLKEVEELIKNDEEVFNFFYSFKSDLSIKYKYVFSENEDLELIIEEGKLYLKEVFKGNTESVREIDVLVINSGEDELEIVFKPKLYKIFYMV